MVVVKKLTDISSFLVEVFLFSWESENVYPYVASANVEVGECLMIGLF